MAKRKMTVAKIKEKKLRKKKEKTTIIRIPKPELAEKRFECGVRDVLRSLKKAKGFERQQQSKRIAQEKTSTKKKLKKMEKANGGKPVDDTETAEVFSKLHRYEREEQVLKTLDLNLTARLHLAHTMLRIPVLMEAQSPLPQFLETIAKHPPVRNGHGSENDLHNVTSSLFNRMLVRESVSKAVTGMCLLLCVPIPERHQRPQWTKAERMAIRAGKLAPDADILKMIDEASDTEEDDEDEEEEKEEEPDTDAEEKALKQFAGRLAGSSDEEDEEEEKEEEEDMKTLRAKYKKALAEGPAEVEEDDEDNEDDEDDEEEMDIFYVDEGPAQEAKSGSAKGSEPESESVSEKEEDDDDSDDDSDEDRPPRKRQATDSAKGKTAADSHFLPTLMGGYISDGGDSSDGSRQSDEAAAERMLGQRKNRRGQRARQAIWEKKYKDEARHLKMQEKKGNDGKGGKDGGVKWDAKRGAVEASDGPRWLRRKLAKEGKQTGGSDGGKEKKVVSESKAKSNEPLHPSWEAARKAKEKAQTAAFEGKKIVFD